MLRTALGGFLLLTVTFGLLYQRLPGTPPATLSEQPSAVGDSNMAAATALRAPSIYITHGGEEDWPPWCLQFFRLPKPREPAAAACPNCRGSGTGALGRARVQAANAAAAASQLASPPHRLPFSPPCHRWPIPRDWWPWPRPTHRLPQAVAQVTGREAQGAAGGQRALGGACALGCV